MPVETHNLGLPVNVLSGQRGHVGLGAAQMPAKLLKRPALRVALIGDDGLVLHFGDGSFLTEANLWPLLLREHRPWEFISMAKL